jgi:hypothetical protein
MNALAGHVVVANLSRKPVDPYAGIEAYRDEIDIGRLRHDLGVSRKVLHQSVIVARRRGALCASFRYCRRCLGRGYYSLVHQFERVSQCPCMGNRWRRRVAGVVARGVPSASAIAGDTISLRAMPSVLW